MEKIAIPFYGNLKDGKHCFAASFKMILKYFFPEKNFSFKKINKMMKKPKNKLAWSCAGLVSLKKMGLDVKFYTNLDFNEFVKNGSEHLSKIYPLESEWMIRNSDINKEIRNAKKMLKYNIFSHKRANFMDVEKWFKKGYIIMFNVNSKTLDSKKGYSGHIVVLTGIIKTTFIFTIQDCRQNQIGKFQKIYSLRLGNILKKSTMFFYSKSDFHEED